MKQILLSGNKSSLLSYVMAAFLIVCVPISSFSQGTDIGIQAGPTVTKAIGKNSVNPHADIGAAAEFFVRYNFNDMIAIRTGLGFEDKGHKYNGLTYTDANGDVRVASVLRHRTKYITVPLLVELTFMRDKKVWPYLNTGLYFGFLVNAKDSYTDNINDNTFRRTVTDDYHVFDMGYVLGAGMKVPIKEHWLVDFGVRNSFGFIKTNKNSNAVINKLLNYSTAFNFGFAYRF